MSYERFIYPRAVFDYREPITITGRIDKDFFPGAPEVKVVVLHTRYMGRVFNQVALDGKAYGFHPEGIYGMLHDFIQQLLPLLHERCPHCLGTGFVPCLGPAPLMTHMHDE